MRAQIIKRRQEEAALRRKRLYDEQMPKVTRDLEVKKVEPTGHFRYAYDGIDVLVTPRKHRPEQTVYPQELTPDRALRKLRAKIKRSLNKAARGEHEAIHDFIVV